MLISALSTVTFSLCIKYANMREALRDMPWLQWTRTRCSESSSADAMKSMAAAKCSDISTDGLSAIWIVKYLQVYKKKMEKLRVSRWHKLRQTAFEWVITCGIIYQMPPIFKTIANFLVSQRQCPTRQDAYCGIHTLQLAIPPHQIWSQIY